MKNRITWYRNRYIVLAVVLFITVLGICFFNGEIEKIVSEKFAIEIQNNADIFNMYFHEYMEERYSSLTDTASLIAKSVFADKDASKEILKERQEDFSSYLVFRTNGKKEYDSSDSSLEITLDIKEYIDTLLKEKKVLIYGNTIHHERQGYIALCAPVLRNGEVNAVLMGLIRLKTLGELLQRWEASQGGCAFIMTNRGEYMVGSEQFDHMLGSRARDFLTYIEQGDTSLSWDELYKMMQQKKEHLLMYRYEGERYVSALSPISGSNWYIGYLDEQKPFSVFSLDMSVRTSLFIWLAVILSCLLVVYIVVLIYRYGLGKEQIQRYDTIRKLDKFIILELDFSPKKLQLFGEVKEMFHVDKSVLHGEEVYEIYHKVHPEDASVRQRLHLFLENDEEVFSAELRLETEEGLFRWFRVRGTLIKDPYTGVNQKFIAKIESADEEIADEKNLVERAENDLLTGVLNKKTMEERVIASLVDIPSSSYRIFFMVDLDNFKNVNDKLGHIMGDQAIIDTATRLAEIFHTDAYVGRLGGDEFAVCASYVAFDEESLYKYIKKKAEKICEVNRRTYVNGDMAVNISSSVGIAIAPDMATDFQDLYKKADSALYKSKNGGKNCYHIYGRD